VIRLSATPVEPKRVDEKIIPMINIIFLLLMFFIIAGNISELVRDDVTPPRSRTAAVATAKPAQWVITREGAIVDGERTLDRQQFAAWLAQPQHTPPDRVVLRVDAATRSGELLPVMEILRDHGVKAVTLVTLNEDGMH
jgi:biopolymer transport protein ExbD